MNQTNHMNHMDLSPLRLPQGIRKAGMKKKAKAN
jgi:hypothetical protein